MNRVIFFVDGFNLYHALNDYEKFHKYKWLNLRKLAKCFITKKDELIDVYYFTAYTYWNLRKVKKHKMLVEALKLKKIKVVEGEYKPVSKNCRKCKNKYWTYEEKETDVNIAIHLFKLAVKDKYDTAIIISCDSDLIPAIEAVKEMYPYKQIGALTPIGRKAEAIKRVCDFHQKIKEKHLVSSLFEKEIDLGNGQNLCALQAGINYKL